MSDTCQGLNTHPPSAELSPSPYPPLSDHQLTLFTGLVLQPLRPWGKTSFETEALVQTWQSGLVLASSWSGTWCPSCYNLQHTQGYSKDQTARLDWGRESLANLMSSTFHCQLLLKSELLSNPKSSTADNIHATLSITLIQCPCKGSTQRAGVWQ